MSSRRKYVLPPNYTEMTRPLSEIPLRNIIEAIVASLLIWYLISQVPFVFSIKIFVTIFSVVITGTVFLVGIKGESVTQFLRDYFFFLKSKRKIAMAIPGTKHPANTSDGIEKNETTQSWSIVEEINYGMIKTRDHRYIKILEISPTNFHLKSETEKQLIISNFMKWLRVAPKRYSFHGTTRVRNTDDLINFIENQMKDERDPKVIKKKNEYVQYIADTAVKDAVTKRYFLAVEYDKSLGTAKNDREIGAALEEIRISGKYYFKKMGNDVVDHQDENLFHAEVLYNYFNVKSSRYESFGQRMWRINSDINKIEAALGKPIDLDVNDYIVSRGIDFTHPGYLIQDGKFVTYLYIKANGYPIQEEGGWMDRLTNYGENIDVTVINELEPRDITRHKIKVAGRFKHSSARTNQNSQEQKERIEKAMMSDYILDALNSGEDLYSTCIIIAIHADTLPELRLIKKNIRRDLYMHDYQAAEMYGNCEIGFRMSLPCLYIHREFWNQSKRNMLSSSIASSYPFTAFELYNEHGTMFGINGLNSSLAVIDIFDTKMFSNANMIILGSSGKGKTFLMLSLLRRMRCSNYRIFQVLPTKGHEHYRACMSVGGTYIKLTPGGQNIINIMEIRPEDAIDEKLINGEDYNFAPLLAKKIVEITTWISLNMGKSELTSSEESLLDMYLTKVYERFGITSDDESIWEDKEKQVLKKMPIIGDLFEEIKNDGKMARIYDALVPYVLGSLKNFNAQTNVDLNNRYITFDVNQDDIPKRLHPAMIFLATSTSYGMIRSNRLSRDILAVDEGWKMIVNEFAAAYITEIEKLIRGYGASFMLSTQELNDLLGYKEGYYGKALINNSRIKVILGMEAPDANLVQQVLEINEEERQQIIGFDRGQGMIFVNDTRVPIFFKATLSEVEDFTTDQNILRELARRKQAEEKTA